MSTRKILSYEFASLVALWLFWFPATSVGPVDRPELFEQIPRNSIDTVISSLDSIIYEVKSGHRPKDTIQFNHILNTLQ